MERLIRKGIYCMLKEGSLLAKVTATIVGSCLVAVVAFGMTAYKHVDNQMIHTDASAVLEYVDEHYTREEVIALQNDEVLRRLTRIESKLDELQREK